jgi:hypothetical protein
LIGIIVGIYVSHSLIFGMLDILMRNRQEKFHEFSMY